MTPRDAARIVGWLVRDTFRQARTSRVTWLRLGLSGLATLTCLSVGVVGGATLHRPGARADFLPGDDPQATPERARAAGVDVVSGELTLAFGAFRAPLGRDARDAIGFLRAILTGTVADAAGVLLALIWTAGVLPGFLRPEAATVLLAEPAPRWLLMAGKTAGVLALVASQAAAFFVGTWLALGLRTGLWDASYLLGIPLMALHFAAFFGASALIAAWTRSTTACAVGSLAFWLGCWGMNYGRRAVAALPRLGAGAAASPLLRAAAEAGYWALPKPADFGLVLARALDTGRYLGPPPEFLAVQELGRFHPALSVVSSLLAAGVLLALACRRLAAAD